MIYSVSNFGYEGQLITVECDVREGTHSLDIVGITDSYVKQTRKIKICNEKCFRNKCR